MRYLAEPEAWREVARCAAEGTDRIPHLCLLASDLEDDGRISYCVYSEMKDRVREHMALDADTGRDHGAWYMIGESKGRIPKPAEERDCRVLAALFLALEATDETKERAA